MNYLVLDCETSTIKKGSPFHSDNRLAVVAIRTRGATSVNSIEYDGNPYGCRLREIQGAIDSCEIIVGFNWKFDGHWLRRYGIKWEHKRIWDCAVYEFLEDAQRTAMPSLKNTLDKYSLGEKETGIEQFWDAGIDTFLVPRDVLWRRAASDAEQTGKLFERQWAHYEKQSKAFKNLFKLEMKDLVALSEMEWNGQLFNSEEARRLGKEAEKALEGFNETLNQFSNGVPVNWNSFNQRSAVLFGGVIKWEERYIDGVVKTGAHAGTPRSRVRHLERKFEPLVDGPERHKLANGTAYSTDESVLRSLKVSGAARTVVDALLQRSELEKLRGTYYEGFSKLLEEFKWIDNVIHGQFHQFVAVTGRLSSSTPNLQNIPGMVKRLFVSRPGHTTVQVDFKTLEWVIALFLSRDPIGIQEWMDHLNGKQMDVHSLNQADLSLPDRLIAKIFLFRLIYGGTEWSYANDPNFNWISENPKFWKKKIDSFYAKYKELNAWHSSLVEETIRTGGYTLPTGRMYRYTPTNHFKRGLEWPRTQILNYPVQGFAAEIVKIARVLVFKRLKEQYPTVLYISSVHDSLVMDVPNDQVNTVMEMLKVVCTTKTQEAFEELFGVPFDLPLKVDISYGPNQKDLTEHVN